MKSLYLKIIKNQRKLKTRWLSIFWMLKPKLVKFFKTTLAKLYGVSLFLIQKIYVEANHTMDIGIN